MTGMMMGVVVAMGVVVPMPHSARMPPLRQHHHHHQRHHAPLGEWL
jgi:hypothetical protein